MFSKLKALFTRETAKPSDSSRCSREEENEAKRTCSQQISETPREPFAHSWLNSSFENFRYKLKDLSKRLEAIRSNPEETYLINTELTLRVLDVLETLVNLTEKNTSSLERLTDQVPPLQQQEAHFSKKRRAGEVLGVLERSGPLSYEELRSELIPPVTYKRITALVSEMIRDGIPLIREGKPVRVSLAETLTGSN
jgi:hypothetical protein